MVVKLLHSMTNMIKSLISSFVRPVPESTLDLDQEELRKRNQRKAEELIKQMGTKYLCHPENKITRIKK